MVNMIMSDLESREQALRNRLVEKPRNAKVMAQLSTVLLPTRREEAIEWAEKSIDRAPQRPFGYVALSQAAESWSERKKALIQAVELSADPVYPLLAHIGLLVRLLIEERQEEAKQSSLGKASPKHPHRRDLTASENQLYQRIQFASTL